MAELLILNQDATPDVKSYKRGDVVVVMEDGHEWGGAEGLPDFVRASLPGVPAASLRDALQMPHQSSPTEYAASAVRAIKRLYVGYGQVAQPEQITRRRYQVPAELMTPDVNGYITLTLAQLKDKKHAA